MMFKAFQEGVKIDYFAQNQLFSEKIDFEVEKSTKIVDYLDLENRQ